MATLTINALYAFDPTIFDGFRVPGINDLDPDVEVRRNAPIISRETAIEKIILDTLGLSLVYPSADDMKRAIKTWTEANYSIWVSLYQTICFKYNPIWNKDGKTVETRSSSYNHDSSGTGLHDVTGFDSSAYSPDTKDHSEGNDNGWNHDDFTRTEQGNIGITSTQELIERERSIAAFSLYQVISESFKHEFCVCIY